MHTKPWKYYSSLDAVGIICSHIQSLLSAHDRVANKEYPYSSAIVDESSIDEQMVKNVRIEKKRDPLVSGYK